MLDELRMNLQHAQTKMKAKADGHRIDVSFKEGDLVYLKLRHYRRRSLASRPNEKLASRFYGPFEVAARVGMVAYKWKLPETACIHPVFYIS